MGMLWSTPLRLNPGSGSWATCKTIPYHIFPALPFIESGSGQWTRSGEHGSDLRRRLPKIGVGEPRAGGKPLGTVHQIEVRRSPVTFGTVRYMSRIGPPRG